MESLIACTEFNQVDEYFDAVSSEVAIASKVLQKLLV
jgi:hypothetical protein